MDLNFSLTSLLDSYCFLICSHSQLAGWLGKYLNTHWHLYRLVGLFGTFSYFLILMQCNKQTNKQTVPKSWVQCILGAMQSVNIWEPNWLDRCLNTHGHVYRHRWIMWRWTRERAWGGGTKDMVAKHVCQFQQKQNLTRILRFIHNINGNATRCVWFGMCKMFDKIDL